MAGARVGYLVLDANDPETLARFWCAVLGVDVQGWFAGEDYLVLTKTSDGLQLAFQRVPEPKAGKNRLHLDLFTDDLEVATERAMEAGGSWDGVEREMDTYRWRCLADPEGNEFDLIPPD